MTERRLEYILDKLYRKINDAMVKTIPKIKPNGKQNHDKWFTEKLHNARKSLTKLKRKYKRKSSERNLNDFLQKVTEYKRLCRNAKEEDFKDFLETLPDIQTLSSFHKNVSRQKPVSYTHLTLPTNREV